MSKLCVFVSILSLAGTVLYACGGEEPTQRDSGRRAADGGAPSDGGTKAVADTGPSKSVDGGSKGAPPGDGSPDGGSVDSGAASQSQDGGTTKADAKASADAGQSTKADGGAKTHPTEEADAGPPAKADGGSKSEPAKTDSKADPKARAHAKLIQDAYRNAKGFEADFVQTYRNKLRGTSKKRTGHVWLRPPDRMRWEYAPPSKNLIVADGRSLFVFEPDSNQVIQTKVSGSQLPSVMAFLTGGKNLETDYRITPVFEKALSKRGQAGLELEPRVTSSVISRVVLVINTKTGKVLRTVLVDTETNTNTFVWSKVKTNETIGDSRFKFTPPAGVRLVKR